jgi:Domain of unknown function (DUF4136)
LFEFHNDWRTQDMTSWFRHQHRLAIGILLFSAYIPSITTAQTVSYNYAEGVNFALLRKYKWASAGCSDGDDNVLELQIRESVDRALAKKGLVMDLDGAQFLIFCQTSVHRERDIRMYEPNGIAWGYGPGWLRNFSYGYNYGFNFVGPPPISTATGSTIRIGDLVLDFYDAHHRDLVWRGEVTQALIFNADPTKLQRRLDKCINKLLQPFPPGVRRLSPVPIPRF